MKQTRRKFLQSAGTIALGVSIGSHNAQSISSESIGSPPPTIREGVLNEYGWEPLSDPNLPNLLDEEELLSETEWEFSAYTDKSHRNHVRTQTDQVVDIDFKYLWATKVRTTDQIGRQNWWDAAGEGELRESIVAVDGATEKAFEAYITDDINGGSLEKVAEGHRKEISWISDIPSVIPYVGPAFSYGVDFLWDAQTSINVATGGRRTSLNTSLTTL